MSDPLRQALQAAVHALRSFQYGNGSEEFAKAQADAAEAALSAPAAEPTTYRPSPETVQAALVLVDRIKASYDHWKGWSGIPSSCETISNMLRYGYRWHRLAAEREVDAEQARASHAAPAQQPLTDEQVKELIRADTTWRECSKESGWSLGPSLFDLVRAIEREHGITPPAPGAPQ